MWVKYELDDMYKFKAWSGGKDTLDDVIQAGLTDELTEYVEEVFSGDEDIPTDTAINDWLWFDRDEIYRHLGLNENGELPDDDDEEEEDVEEEEERNQQ